MPTTTLTRRRSALDTDALADIALALLSARHIWRSVARFDPDVRQPVRLLADSVFEAWVIGWFSGQALDLHDHGDSAGAVVVAEGRLHETTLGNTELGRNRLETRSLERGFVRRIAAHTVHGIANPDARAATSIHVYSPPLARMTHFDPVDLREVQTVSIEPETPMLPAAVAQLVRIDRRV